MDSRPQEAPGASDRITTLGACAGAADEDVPDPIGGSDESYRACADRIEGLVRRALPRLAAGMP